MREIKFRAWNTITETMIIPSLDEGWILFEGIPSVRNDFINNYILMQYTGLKDKNGKEIYEGDIVRCPQMKSYHNKELLKVIYNPPEFSLSLGENVFYFKTKKWDYEVIGNVYENPEML